MLSGTETNIALSCEEASPDSNSSDRSVDFENNSEKFYDFFEKICGFMCRLTAIFHVMMAI